MPEPDEVKGTIAFSFGAEHNEVYPVVATPARIQAESLGYEFIEGAAFGDIERQVRDIESFIARGVDAIVFLPLGGLEPYEAVVQEAKDVGIVVVGYFLEVPGADANIVGDEAQGGELLAREAVRWLNEEYTGDLEDFTWAIFTNDPLPSAVERTDAIRRVMAEAIGVEPMEAHAVAAEEGLNATEVFLQRDPGLNMVLGVNDAGALGAHQAFLEHLQETGRDPGEVFLGGVDGQNEALELMRDGGGPLGIYRASGASLIFLWGEAVANVPINILEGGPAENVNIDYVLLTPADADELRRVLELYDEFVGAS